MKTRTFSFLLLALFGGALAAVPGDVARADDKPRAGVWVFDVRIVRVDPATPEVSETQSVFEQAEGTTVPMGWPQILDALKKRGKTTILMDQRLTTVEGVKGRLNNVVDHPILMVNFSDDNNTQRRQAAMKTGCSFEVIPTSSEMTYQVESRWALMRTQVKDTQAPPQGLTAWQGTHPALTGDTLVLHSREQIETIREASVKAVEFYALVTGRFIAK